MRLRIDNVTGLSYRNSFLIVFVKPWLNITNEIIIVTHPSWLAVNPLVMDFSPPPHLKNNKKSNKNNKNNA